MNSASAKVLPLAKRLYGARAPPARRPVGWLAWSFPNLENIDFDHPLQKEGHLLSADVLLSGFRSLWPPPPFGVRNAREQRVHRLIRRTVLPPPSPCPPAAQTRVHRTVTRARPPSVQVKSVRSQSPASISSIAVPGSSSTWETA